MVQQIDEQEALAYFERLPARFRDDVLVRENLANLESDVRVWKGEP